MSEQSGDSGKNQDEGGDGGGESFTVILRAFMANVGIAIAKFVAAAMTGSTAMMTEGIHSTVDSLNQVFMYIGQKRAQKPADKLHPLGYSQELYFWSFVVAVMIFAIGAGVAGYEAYHTFMKPEPTKSPSIALGVLGIAFLLEGWSWLTAWKEFNNRRDEGESVAEGIRNTKDTTSLVVLLEDSAAVTGIVLAAAGIGLELLTGSAIWDGVASAGIALLLAFVALILLREAKDLLIGEAADPELVESIRSIIDDHRGVDSVSEVITMHMGPDEVLALVTVDFENDLSAGELEQEVAKIQSEIRKQNKQVARAFVHPRDEARHGSANDSDEGDRASAGSGG